jgi:putative transcription antitermination factor YqgF
MFDILAIDWGSRKIGLAYGSYSTELVLPESQLTSADQIWNKLETEISRRKIETIVVGWPMNFHSQPTATTYQVQNFIEQLTQRFPAINIETINERQTTQKFAQQKLFKNPKKLDNLAAQEILERYLQRLKK